LEEPAFQEKLMVTDEELVKHWPEEAFRIKWCLAPWWSIRWKRSILWIIYTTFLHVSQNLWLSFVTRKQKTVTLHFISNLCACINWPSIEVIDP